MGNGIDNEKSSKKANDKLYKIDFRKERVCRYTKGNT